MPLTDVYLRSLKPEQATRKLFDGRGLYLELKPSGTKAWRMKYRFGKKEKLLSLGLYPEVGLKAAREALEDARRKLSHGIDPSAERKATKASAAGVDRFESIAREWIAGQSATWAPNHTKRVLSLFENDLFPFFGDQRAADITAPELLIHIRRVEKRVLERAHRALGNCGQVFRYAIATGRAERNPAADLKGALPPFKGKHFSAPTDPKAFEPLLRTMYSYQGTPTVVAALKPAPLLFARPGELRKAQWADMDLEAAEWRYVSSKTKVAHIVPLASQAIAILTELRRLNGRSDYVFPSARSSKRPMSDNAILAALRRMGIEKDELTGHGLRATARTILDEVLGFRPDFIEHQLAHSVKDPNGRAYNRTAHLEERRKMMQVWADYCDKLRRSEVLEMPKRA